MIDELATYWLSLRLRSIASGMVKRANRQFAEIYLGCYSKTTICVDMIDH